MAKLKSPGGKNRNPSLASASLAAGLPSEAPPPAAAHHILPSKAAIREAIESVAIAFILAFLFRTFEAEAFVIPTGSMATTLMGRHKDLVCPKCGCPYQVSASEEVCPDGSPREEFVNGVRRPTDRFKIMSGTCPMCRYTDEKVEKETSFNGDRILVNKFAYQIAEPQRWDVIVFKYPGDPLDVRLGEGGNDSRFNYIKRLIGLPGDTIRIKNGDIWMQSAEAKAEAKKSGGTADFVITRRPGPKLLAMLQPVFDNDYMPRIAELGWPVRWRPDQESSAKVDGSWRTDDPATFSIDGANKGEQWLRYHHQAPDYRQWQQAAHGMSPVPKPQLITDYTAYNTGKMRMAGIGPSPDGLGAHWVGDLAVECTTQSENADGQLIFELRKGGRQFQCRFDLSTGKATLSISGPGMADWRPTASTAVRGQGSHKIIFANCDNELRLWVDGSQVSFDKPTTYGDLNNTEPDRSDLSPVGIASAGAKVRISHLRVLRDIYYIADKYVDQWNWSKHDVSYPPSKALPGEELRSSPPDFVEFEIGPDRFFVLGDNSAKSKDGRLWGPEYWVPRDLLIGKAMFIYWPHTWDQIPYVDIPFPYFPNFGRMGLVR
jgi:signal peptidase I